MAWVVGRDFKRVQDIVIIAKPGFPVHTESDGLVCPITSMHIDRFLSAACWFKLPTEPVLPKA